MIGKASVPGMGFAVLLASLLTNSSAHAQVTGLSVGQLRSDVGRDTRVDGKRTGVLCVPSGSVTWADAAPDPASGTAAIVSALTQAGLTARIAEDASDAPGAWRRVTATVVAAQISACVPQHGLMRALGGRKKLKAEGAVTFRWRVIEPDAAKLSFEWESTEPIEATSGSPSLPALVVAAAGRSARALMSAKRWTAGPATTP